MPDTGGEIGLPAPFRLAGFEGPLSEYLQRLEWQYRAVVGEAGLRLWGKPIAAAAGDQAADGRDRRFWHVITDGTNEHTESSRVLSLGRCSMLGQVWALLELAGADDPRVMWWRRHGTVFVAPVDLSMVVLLQEARGSLELKTFYPLPRKRQRNRYLNQAAASWLAGESQRVDTRHRKWRAYCKGSRPPAAQLRKAYGRA